MVDMAAGRSHHHTQKAPVPPSGFGPGVRHEPLTSCAPARGNHPGSAGRRTGQPPWRPPRRGRCGNNTSGRQARIRVDCEVCEVAFARGGHRRTSSPRGLLRPRPPGSFFPSRDPNVSGPPIKSTVRGSDTLARLLDISQRKTKRKQKGTGAQQRRQAPLRAAAEPVSQQLAPAGYPERSTHRS